VSVNLTDKAGARCAASAQASFPSRRAREKTVPEKVRVIDVREQLRRKQKLIVGSPKF